MEENVNKKEQNNIKKNIEDMDCFEKMACFKMSVQGSERSSESDLKYIELYQQGVEKQDILLMYQLVEACERGCGILCPQEMQTLWDEACERDLNKAFEVTDKSIATVMDAVIRVKCMTEAQKEQYLTRDELGNIYVIWEIVRSGLRTRAGEVAGPEKLAIGVKKIAAHDKNLWKRFLQKNEYTKHWYEVLPYVIPMLPETDKLLYAGTIDLKHTEEDLAMVSGALRKLEDKDMEQFMAVAAPVIIERWEEYCDLAYKAKSFLNHIMISAYTDLICWSYYYVYGKKEQLTDKIHSEINRLFDELFWWYERATHLQSRFFQNLTTVLFLWSCLPEEEYDRLDKNKLRQLKNVIKRMRPVWHEKYLSQADKVEKMCID